MLRIKEDVTNKILKLHYKKKESFERSHWETGFN